MREARSGARDGERTVDFRVEGLVQGVGFRPFVWRLATELGLDGWVLNDGQGVSVTLRGPAGAIALWLERLRFEAPPLARIDGVEERASAVEVAEGSGFSIHESEGGEVATGIVPDAATCKACLAEVFNPADRRHRYAFTNCTHCGPRFSIVEGIPYDRATTTMASFVMCPRCEAEYRNPADRRFHAQPNACPSCGPRIWLEDTAGKVIEGEAIDEVARRLKEGAIVAIKGIGGFHLACDARNEASVADLRSRKRREAKPFALMVADLQMARRYCEIVEGAKEALLLGAAPLVLLPAKEVESVAASVAMGQPDLALMLPYTPLHHRLLLAFGGPLVMTSANETGAPQVIDNDEARRELSGQVDAFLVHDRPIAQRLDDSLAFLRGGRLRLLRRARGYAPAPMRLHRSFATAPSVLAMGGELKVTACWLRAGGATLTQHLGDLQDARTAREYERTLELYRRLFRFEPAAVAVDFHRDYRSTFVGERMAAEAGLALVAVQHHHAHIASVLAERGWALEAAPVLAIAMDGIGAAEDGEWWGCELMVADFRGYRRVGSLRRAALIGGAKAMREPWRNLLAQLEACFGWELAAQRFSDHRCVQRLAERGGDRLIELARKGLNAPVASSAGRLFDAVAAALGLHDDGITFEGQAAMALEALARRARRDRSDAYPFSRTSELGMPRLDPSPMWEALFEDLDAGRPFELIAARFHHGFAQAAVDLCVELASEASIETVALSGGVLQNRVLCDAISDGLERTGLAILDNAGVPANDGGISLGQAAIVAAKLTMGSSG